MRYKNKLYLLFKEPDIALIMKFRKIAGEYHKDG